MHRSLLVTVCDRILASESFVSGRTHLVLKRLPLGRYRHDLAVILYVSTRHVSCTTMAVRCSLGVQS